MQPKRSDWADSVRAWASAYKDSVVVDYDASQMRYIYVAKGEEGNYKASSSEYDELSHALQYYIVPAFIAIIFAYLVFGSLLMNDNAKALRNGDRGTILGMVNNKKNERRI